MKIRDAGGNDRGAVLDLLAARGLPLDGIDPGLDGFVVAADGASILGVAGLERYDGSGLLRSVAVRTDQQGKGLARSLVEETMARARRSRLDAVYLLTTTAEGYFPRLGFARTERGLVPPAIQASVEFATACPSSAVAMVRRVGTSPS